MPISQFTKDISTQNFDPLWRGARSTGSMYLNFTPDLALAEILGYVKFLDNWLLNCFFLLVIRNVDPL